MPPEPSGDGLGGIMKMRYLKLETSNNGVMDHELEIPLLIGESVALVMRRKGIQRIVDGSLDLGHTVTLSIVYK